MEAEFDIEEIETFIKENGQTYYEMLKIIGSAKSLNLLLDSYYFKYGKHWFPLRSPKWEARDYVIADFLRTNTAFTVKNA